MSNFEFLLSLFGLLLGFTLVEVLSGLVRTTKALRTHQRARQIKVGWLTPLLALFVILDVTSYWANLWLIREGLPVGFDTVFGSLLIAGGYYFAASMVFPDDADECTDLDEWFWQHRRQVIGPLIIINVFWVLTLQTLNPDDILIFLANVGLYFVLLVIAFWVRSAAIVIGALGFSSFIYIALAIDQLIARLV